MTGWYSRPVLLVAEVERSIEFYNRAGFDTSWRYDENGRTVVAQVARPGCELILSEQWPEKAGKSMMFLSLDRADYDALRPALEANGIVVDTGHWGYPSLVVTDPDGNSLWFPDPGKPE